MWPYPRILAHRGGGTLAPENTLAALRCGLAYGYRAVEFDVMLARDGVPVVDARSRNWAARWRAAAPVPDHYGGATGADGGGQPGWRAVRGRGRAHVRGRGRLIARRRHLDEYRDQARLRLRRADGRGGGARHAHVLCGGNRRRGQLPLLSSFSIAAWKAARPAAPDCARPAGQSTYPPIGRNGRRNWAWWRSIATTKH